MVFLQNIVSFFTCLIRDEQYAHVPNLLDFTLTSMRQQLGPLRQISDYQELRQNFAQT